MNNPLVSTDWLFDHLKAPDIVILDGSWYLPTENRDPKSEYLEQHIPGALFFDIDANADQNSNLPHMLPDAVVFASMMRKLGIGDGQRLVVYDRPGMLSAARVWWTFRAMGVEDVYVLDGGLTKWMGEARPVASGTETGKNRHFSARLDHSLVRNLAHMQNAVETGNPMILDARPSGRFSGEMPEPRERLNSGHMPGAVSLPHMQLLNSGRFKSPEDLNKIFEQLGVNRNKPVITTCGSGITACVLALGLAITGHRKVAVYDGSWAEWASQEDTQILSDISKE